METDCIFCRIAAGEAPAAIVYHDDEITAFWDRRPAAPVHILVIPNKHMDTLNQADTEDTYILGKMILKAKEIAAKEGVDERGYRIVFNTGTEGGQSVYHVHLHLIAGKKLPVFHG
ncbi:MAG: histidine triad nucleotide-binding protein [Pelolinea sp.]|nr:histidine triad nucleotide-binding protein [Pelolinea sp.]